MNPSAERREDADAPVAEIVAAALDQNRAVVRDDAGGGGLIGEVAQEILGRLLIEIVVRDQALNRPGRGHVPQRPHELTDLPAELERPSGGVGLPERHLAGLAGRRGHEDAIVGDLFDAPRRGPEQERLADAALEDHLFVELADARAGPAFAEEEDPVESAVGNRAAVDDRDALCAFPRGQPVLQAIPGEARAEIGEVVRRIASRQHVEDTLVDRSAQVGKRRGAADGVVQRVDVPLVGRHHRDDLLGEDVERVAGIADRLDAGFVHRARHRGARDEIAAELRNDDPPAGGADRVPRAADPLHAARHRRRRLDLHDEVDRAHVDAQLERRRRDQAADGSGLEPIFDLDTLGPRERSVV